VTALQDLRPPEAVGAGEAPPPLPLGPARERGLRSILIIFKFSTYIILSEVL
jgi:hypothetical protein